MRALLPDWITPDGRAAGPPRRNDSGAGHAFGEDAARSAWRAAFLVALGIGLHNLGEGLAIGSAYAVGSLALGASLVVGFALHNTTEGLAIVAPTARARLSLGRLALLGLLAGAPAVLGAWIGASAFHPSVAALLFGVGAGAIAQVIVQILPQVRERDGRLLSPLVPTPEVSIAWGLNAGSNVQPAPVSATIRATVIVNKRKRTTRASDRTGGSPPTVRAPASTVTLLRAPKTAVR